MKKNKKAASWDGEPVLEGSLTLYRSVRTLHSSMHGDKAVRRDADGFDFAAKAPLIPITVDEFERAALDYPIVFVGPERRAFVVMGLTPERNLFVGADGTFARGRYIPAYLRRYPFVFARDEAQDIRILCLDEASDRIVARDADGADPLFDGENASVLTLQAVDFCQQFESAEHRTERLAKLLEEHDLFVPREATWTPAGEGAATELLIAFADVDRAKLDGLSTDAFAKLRDAGAVGAIYAQLLSAANWPVLAQRGNV